MSAVFLLLLLVRLFCLFVYFVGSFVCLLVGWLVRSFILLVRLFCWFVCWFVRLLVYFVRSFGVLFLFVCSSVSDILI